MKIAVVGANFDSGNMGVGALMMGAIACAKHAWPNAEIILMDYDNRPKTIQCHFQGRILPILMVPMRFTWKIFLPNNIATLLLLTALSRVLPWDRLRKWIYRRNPALRSLDSCDQVLSVAGGDSFSDIYGPARFIYIVLPLLWALGMKKDLVILPQTIGPFQNPIARGIAGFILRRSRRVFARDAESLDLARKLMGTAFAAKARFCHDMGFLLEPKEPRQSKWPLEISHQDKLLVGLNISGLLLIGGYSRKNMFALKVEYGDLVRAILHYLVVERQVRVILVPHVFGKSAESDERALEVLYAEMSPRLGADLIPIRGRYDQNEIKYVIGKCDYFIGSRMHACIAALSQGIPSLGIAYSRKFKGVMDSLDVPGLVADPRVSNLPEILVVIGKSLDLREANARLLRERMPKLKAGVVRMLGDP